MTSVFRPPSFSKLHTLHGDGLSVAVRGVYIDGVVTDLSQMKPIGMNSVNSADRVGLALG